MFGAARRVEPSHRAHQINEAVRDAYMAMRNRSIDKEAAFTLIIPLIQGPIMRLFRAHGVKNESDREDLFSEFMVRLLKSETNARYDPAYPFLYWAYKIARRQCYSFLSARRF